jgi:mycofactocin system glycosyltransferase
LEGVARQDYPPRLLRVTVVDDGSPAPVRQALPGAVPAQLTVRWLRLPANGGPASARNAGVRAPWPDAPGGWGTVCAFIDSDCVPAADWLGTLVSALEDPGLAAVGGRVTGLHGHPWLARYEAACSSLQLGASGGAAGDPAHRHAYLPSCNLVVRRAALHAVGGFRPGLRLGEDVDLCWRLRAAGQRLFYYPGGPASGGGVAHEHRHRLGAFLGRKRAYARSEAWLRRMHPGHFPAGGLAGLRAVAVAAALLYLASWGWALAALVLGLATESAVHALRRPRLPAPVALPALLPALGRRAGAGLAQVCRGAVRATLVLWPPAVALLPRLWLPFTVLLALGGWAEWQSRRPALRPWEFAAGFLLDALGYSVGRLEGLLRERWR